MIRVTDIKKGENKMNNKRDAMGDRFKEYEAVSNIKLTRRTPVILRLDMCHGHTFTRGFDKPFDKIFIYCMQETMKYLCEHIQGCAFGYTQSDEISLVLVDYKELETAAWFDNKIEKICSVAASLATFAFNKSFAEEYQYLVNKLKNTDNNFAYGLYDGLTKYKHAYESGAIFDCRCFNVPKEEVANYFYWRQKDAVRNSIEATAQANFSQKELQGKGQGELLEMLKSKGVMWFEIPLHEQRGAACLKTPGAGWSVTLNIPMFKGDEGRNFIERYIYVNE